VTVLADTRAPLNVVVPPSERDKWTWKGTVLRGQRVIERYQHQGAGGFLNLDRTGQPWLVEFSDVPGEPARVEPLSMAAAMDRAMRREVRCPYCRAVLPGLLAACTQPACLSRDLDHDMRHTRMEDQ